MAASPTFAPLKSRALIALGGPDWRGFLQGLITQDVETMAPGEARFGALLTPQGRLLHDMFVVMRPDGTAWLDVEAGAREAIVRRLMMYRLRAKVEIGVDGAPVSALIHHPEPAAGAIWVTDPRLPELGWRCYGEGSSPVAVAATMAAPIAAPVPADEAAYDAHRLSLGVPGPADWGSDATYPIEANFDLLNGIDFRKGCFVGQETTSRMKRRGVIKNRMLPLLYDGPPPAHGAEVLAGELRAGVSLSGAAGRSLALVRLDRAVGAELTVEGRPARVEVPTWMAAAIDARPAPVAGHPQGAGS